jgi:acylphosphatase
MENKICKHWYVSGKVQGVWFRASTVEQARQLGLMGWVRNLEDGRVEVLACGDQKKIEQLHEWLKHGPKLAKVSDLLHEEIPWQEHEEFKTR